MSDSKKYYYLKLKDNYFDQDSIKVLESMPNGHTYSLIILKLYLKSCKYEGHLRMTERIPYDPDKMEILANVIGHDIAHLREAIKMGSELGLITLFDSGDIWMTEIQNFIGHSSTEADRKRLYRHKMDKQLIIADTQQGDKCPDKNPPEKEIERESEKEIELEQSFNDFWDAYGKKVDTSKCKKKWFKLPKSTRESIMQYVPEYVQRTPDKQFRKNPMTFLNGECWNDELPEQKQSTAPPNSNMHGYGAAPTGSMF